MKVRVTLDKAGRVMIPEQLLAELKLARGDALALESTVEEITLRPVRASSPLTQEHGVWVLHTGQPLPASATNEILQQVHEERDLANCSNSE